MRYLFFSFIHNVLTHPLLFISDVLDALLDACLRFKGHTLLFAMPLVYAAQGITWLHDWSGDMMAPPARLKRIPDVPQPFPLSHHGGIASVAHVKASDFNGDGFAKTMAIAIKALDDEVNILPRYNAPPPPPIGHKELTQKGYNGGISKKYFGKMADFVRPHSPHMYPDGFAETMGIAKKALDDQREGKDFTESVASQLSEQSAADYEKAREENFEAWKQIIRRGEV